jgi:hypothetical protein
MAEKQRRFVMPKEVAAGPHEPADVCVVPAHEAWAVTPESTATTDASLADYGAGRAIGVKSLDARIAGRRNRRK